MLTLDNSTGLSAFHYAWDLILLNPSNSVKKQALLRLFPQDEGGLDERQFSRIHKCVLGLIGSSLQDELSVSTSVIDDFDNIGRTPLYWAACRGDEKFVRLLLEFDAKPDLVPPGRGMTSSPLHAAASSGHDGIVSKLLRHGAPVDGRGEGGVTPLFLAAGFNDGNRCIQVLLQHGAAVDARDSEDRTPLITASQNGMLQNARLLLQRGANIDHVENEGWTPLACCIFWNMHDSIRLLLSSGASQLVRTKEGDTLLHAVARYGDVETLGLLVDEGALGDVDVEARNGVGKTAGGIAEARKSDEREGWYDAFQRLVGSITDRRGRGESEKKEVIKATAPSTHKLKNGKSASSSTVTEDRAGTSACVSTCQWSSTASAKDAVTVRLVEVSESESESEFGSDLEEEEGRGRTCLWMQSSLDEPLVVHETCVKICSK
jgi:ankyrin repeat protein